MFWLFAQMFVLCGFAFLAGAVLTWLPLRATIRTLRSELALTPTHPTRPALPPATVLIPPQAKPEPGAEPEPEWGLEATLEVVPEAALVSPPTPAAPAPTASETAAPAPATPATAASATAASAIPVAAHSHTAPVAAEVVGVVVKGSSKSMIFHTPDSPYFNRMKGDVTFRSIAEAEEAGYTRWRPKTAAAPAR